jgi:hypothetical protein
MHSLRAWSDMTVGLDERESLGNIPNGEDLFKDSKSKEANLSIGDATLAPWIVDPPPGQHADQRLMTTGVPREQSEERSRCDNTVRKFLYNLEILLGIIRFHEGLESLARQSPLATTQPDPHHKPNTESDRGLLDLALLLDRSLRPIDALDVLFPHGKASMVSISDPRVHTPIAASKISTSKGEREYNGSNHLTRNQYVVHQVSFFLPLSPTSIPLLPLWAYTSHKAS